MANLHEMATGWDYSDSKKKAFHKEAKRILNLVAYALNLNKDSFEIRSNKGGPAVLGEVTLHGEEIYICLGGSVFSEQFYYRTVKGRKDYYGGNNNWMKYETLCDNFDAAIRSIKMILP